MKTTAEQFKRLLPTLRHVAKFPSCNRAAICRRDGVGVAELDAVIIEACGSPAIFDEDYLAKIADELGVDVGAHSALPAPRSAPVTGTKPASVMPGSRALALERDDSPPPAAAKPAPAAKATAPATKSATSPTEPLRIKPAILALCEALLADPALSEGRACAAANVASGSWCYWKTKHLGPGLVDRARLREVIARCDRSAAPAKPAPAARPKPPLAPIARDEARAAAWAASNTRLPANDACRPLPVDVTTLAQPACSILDEVNALLASYRIEVVAVRLVPAGKEGAE